MYHGREAVTTFSVQGRLRLGGGGLRLASTTGEKQGDDNKCETMKWFEFFHGASVSNEHATSFAQLQVKRNAGCRFENETDRFRFREKHNEANAAPALIFLAGASGLSPRVNILPTADSSH